MSPLSNDPAANLAGLLKAADQALCRAKEAGRNRVETSPFVAEHVPLRRPKTYQFINDPPRKLDFARVRPFSQPGSIRENIMTEGENS